MMSLSTFLPVKAPPAYATRINSFTPYELIIRHAKETKELIEEGNPDSLRTRQLKPDPDGGSNPSNYLRYLNGLIKEKDFPYLSKVERQTLLKLMMQRLVDEGFLRVKEGSNSIIYCLTDLYKTRDVNELLDC
ncbi:TPA: hypothetical protein JG871_004243 [Enterobacter hormaechei subsp. xiangfangensis]|nr:hypothetical protein [Enterobacter hormaechei subsp. xiangfangensis]